MPRRQHSPQVRDDLAPVVSIPALTDVGVELEGTEEWLDDAESERLFPGPPAENITG